MCAYTRRYIYIRTARRLLLYPLGPLWNRDLVSFLFVLEPLLPHPSTATSYTNKQDTYTSHLWLNISNKTSICGEK